LKVNMGVGGRARRRIDGEGFGAALQQGSPDGVPGGVHLGGELAIEPDLLKGGEAFGEEINRGRDHDPRDGEREHELDERVPFPEGAYPFSAHSFSSWIRQTTGGRLLCGVPRQRPRGMTVSSKSRRIAK
jgi:hypothetical protein